jgi:hypothetical protein
VALGSRTAAIDEARCALAEITTGRAPDGLARLGRALAAEPTDLVIGNAFRMEVLRMKREFLAESRRQGARAPLLPAHLRDEPLATLEAIRSRTPGREIALQVALAHVDRMILNPALEIRAPASIDSVRELNAILTDADSHYVPALFARGLNHLHRPLRLAWPERPAPAKDAASRDLGLAVAIGARIGGAPARLRGRLLIALGDAYAHEDRIGIARSWWATARETCSDAWVRSEVALRMAWTDGEAADRLEELLAERVLDQDHPLSDLSFLWEGAGGSA